MGLGRWLRHPARLVPVTFVGAIAAGTLLLMLPFARAGDKAADPLTALFTSTSAVCVTGLATVDTGTYWTLAGQGIILALIQIGGFGIAAGATLAVWLIMGRLGLNTRMLAQAETRASSIGGARRILVFIGTVTIVTELVLAVVLTLRMRTHYEASWTDALWGGVFHSISAFNNAGFSIYEDSLIRFAADPLYSIPLSLAVIIGGIGFPVLLELRRNWRRRRGEWSLHTRLTLRTYGALLLLAFLVVLTFEWTNSGTLGLMSTSDKLVTGFVEAVQPRTSGFASVNYTEMREETLSATLVLMFIGGGSAGTAGGIKVTTFVILAFVLLAEARGDEDVSIFNRRIARSTQRQAVSVVLLAVGAIFVGATALMAWTTHGLGETLFEATSAFATVGLSMGITGDLGPLAQGVVIVLMYLGRVGPVAAFAFFALRSTQRNYRYPEARPLVG